MYIDDNLNTSTENNYPKSSTGRTTVGILILTRPEEPAN